MHHHNHKGENRIIRRRLLGSYLSTVVSISLVLLLVGVATFLIVNARKVSDYFKESLQISVILKQEVSDEDALAYSVELAEEPFIHSARLVSREEGTEELKAMLGEDFLNVFETSPVPVSVDINLVAGYVSADSIEVVKSKILDSQLVDDVECQQSLVDALNANLTKISIVLSVFIALMLFISFVLINNTVRLDVFSRRFTVHTMKLVGATRSFIRAPFIWRAVMQGLAAALLSIAILRVLMGFVKRSFPALFEIFDTGGMLTVMSIVIACGILICGISTWLVVNKLLGLSKDELYG